MAFEVKTAKKREVINITNRVEELLPNSDGLVNIFVKHTTAAITTTDLDPGTDLDFLDFLQSLVPNIKWRHPHDPSHVPDHLLAALIGPSVDVPFKAGKLVLGAWQEVVLVEFNGPHQGRQVEVTAL